MQRSFLPLLVLVLVLVSGVASLGMATSPPQDSADENLTLEELQEDGVRHANSPASVRMAGQDRMFWLVHWPAGDAFSNPGEDDNWQFIEPGTTVKRNAIYLRTIHFGEPETVTVKVASWQKRTRTVTGPNGSTTTETVATKVSVTTTEVQINQGWPQKKIELPRHDREHQVTVWIEEYPGARWSSFSHRSVATTKSIGIETWGDYLERNLVTTYIPTILVLILVLWAVKRAIDVAGTGPQWGYVPWFILITVVSVLGFAIAYTQLADLFVLFPAAAALYIGAIVAAIALETYTNNTSTVEFWQPRLEFAQSPTGELAWDSTFARKQTHTLVDMPDGSRAVVKGGLFPFLSRCFGGAARLQLAEEVTTRVHLEDSSSDELWYVHPLAEEVVDYDQEGWTIAMPEFDSLRDLIVPVGLGALVVSLVYAVAGVTLALFAALGVGAALTVRPESGYAKVWPAPYHTRSAHHTVMNFTEEVADADTLDRAQEQLVRERVHPEVEVQKRMEQKDKTLVAEMVGADVDSRLVPPDADANVSEDVTEDERESDRQNGEVPEDGD